jgi:MFS family permease
MSSIPQVAGGPEDPSILPPAGVVSDIPAPEVETAALSPWRNRDFLLFLLGESTSLMGTQVSDFALPLTAIYLFHMGAQGVGLLRGAQLVPYLALSLLVGVWVDRRRRRPLMLLANAVRFTAVASVPLLHLLGVLHAPALYVAALVAGCAAVVFDLSSMSFMPGLVRGRRNLVQANGIIGVSTYAASTAGPAAAGFLVNLLTAPIAMAVDAGSYVVSMLTLWKLRPQEMTKDSGRGRSLRRELDEGLRFVFGHQHLRPLAFVGGAFNFFSVSVISMFMVYAATTLHMNPSRIGLVLSVAAIAGVAASMGAKRLLARYPLGAVYFASVATAFVGPVVIAAASGPAILVFTMLAAGCALMSAGNGVSGVVVLSLRQTITPDHLLGRMNAGFRTVLHGGGALGGPVGGALAVVAGVHGALWVLAVCAILMVGAVALSPVSRLATMPETHGT